LTFKNEMFVSLVTLYLLASKERGRSETPITEIKASPLPLPPALSHSSKCRFTYCVEAATLDHLIIVDLYVRRLFPDTPTPDP
jgi:hypothetical protein